VLANGLGKLSINSKLSYLEVFINLFFVSWHLYLLHGRGGEYKYIIRRIIQVFLTFLNLCYYGAATRMGGLF
jgi:hypothetical protein